MFNLPWVAIVWALMSSVWYILSHSNKARMSFSMSVPLGALVLLIALDVYLSRLVTVVHEQLRYNFKVELQWLPITELT